MRSLLAVSLLMLAGCSSPVSPSLAVSPVSEALSVLDSIDKPLPWNGLTMRQWRQQLRAQVRIEPLDKDYAAVWTGDAVVINANLTGYDVHGLAGIIAHELRHADGIGHDCGPHQDRRGTAWSAYAVHVWTLRALGEEEQARGNEGGFCD